MLLAERDLALFVRYRAAASRKSFGLNRLTPAPDETIVRVLSVFSRDQP
jgi:hypothetical protein